MKVKICGVATIDDAEKICVVRPDAIGVYFRWDPGKGPNFTSLETAKVIVSMANAYDIATFFLTYLEDAAEIHKLTSSLMNTHFQLLGDISASEITKLRRLRPTAKIVKVIGVTGSESIDEADRYLNEDTVDEILLDSRLGSMRGATGKVHDWKISKQIITRSKKPVWLAGGIRLTNVRLAMEEVGPYGIDIETGVQLANGLKDYTTIRQIVNMLHEQNKATVKS